jgi:hypothetical protein
MLGERPAEEAAAALYDESLPRFLESGDGAGQLVEVDQRSGSGFLVRRWEFRGLTLEEACVEAAWRLGNAEREDRDPGREEWFIDMGWDEEGFYLVAELWYP